MQYEGNIIRPPSEAHSIILQVTTGCSHNRCTFCGAYRDKTFRIREDEFIAADLQFAATYCKRQRTVFLADGNVLAIPQKKLIQILAMIRNQLPQVRRVSLYANCSDILKKSVDDLLHLKELGVKRVYMGLESGHDPTLKLINKGADASEMIQAGRRVREAGLFLSITVLLGIAGIQNSNRHAVATAFVLNRIMPNQIAVLTLMILENTPLGEDFQNGIFRLPDRKTLFAELRALIAHLEPFRTQLHSNHASNYIELKGRLPRDKDKIIQRIDEAINGLAFLKPETLRAL